jgi:hypothetical protein
MGKKEIKVDEENFTEDITIKVEEKCEEERTEVDTCDVKEEKLDFTEDITLVQIKKSVSKSHNLYDVCDSGDLPNDYNIFICEGQNKVLVLVMPSVHRCEYKAISIKNNSSNYALKLVTHNGEYFNSCNLEDQYMLQTLGYAKFIKHNDKWLCLHG